MNEIEIIEYPDIGMGRRWDLELKFHRTVYGSPEEVKRKSKELMREVAAWLGHAWKEEPSVEDFYQAAKKI